MRRWCLLQTQDEATTFPIKISYTCTVYTLYIYSIYSKHILILYTGNIYCIQYAYTVYIIHMLCIQCMYIHILVARTTRVLHMYYMCARHEVHMCYICTLCVYMCTFIHIYIGCIQMYMYISLCLYGWRRILGCIHFNRG